MLNPLCIDLFCGLGGWAEGFLAEGYEVIGFDIERHRYPQRKFSVSDESTKSMSGKDKHGNTLMNRALEQVHGFHRSEFTGEWDEYPAQLVLQDVLTLHGSQFRDAAVIVASPPCQAYSYRAMPWKRAKALPPPSNELFDACFRIQREACAAAGRYIPLVVENVKGAQPWVGRAAWHYGSFYLWGDVPALMPMASGRKSTVGSWDTSRQNYTPDHSWEPAVKNSSTAGDSWFNVAHGKRIPGNQTGSPQRGDGMKVAMNFHEHEKTGKPGRSFQSAAVNESVKNGNDWFGSGENCSLQRRASSGSSARKAASAMIAKIPFALSQHIAQVYRPCVEAACV